MKTLRFCSKRERKEEGGDKDLFTHLFCDPTSHATIVSVFLMTANSSLTAEVSKVVWKDLGGGIHLTCLMTLYRAARSLCMVWIHVQSSLQSRQEKYIHVHLLEDTSVLLQERR